MHTLAQLPSDFWVIAVIIFGAVYVWVLVALMSSQVAGGWSSFAKRYPAQARPAGSAYSVSSCRFCNVYSSGRGIRVIFTDTGVYFCMTFFSRLANPPFLLPWESVNHVKKGYGFLGEYFIMEIKDAAGTFSLDLPKKIEYDLSRYYKALSTSG
ncbi:MAG: hypothetical protein ABSF60_13835 [Verrucomicrobiota bacterium]